MEKDTHSEEPTQLQTNRRLEERRLWHDEYVHDRIISEMTSPCDNPEYEPPPDIDNLNGMLIKNVKTTCRRIGDDKVVTIDRRIVFFSRYTYRVSDVYLPEDNEGVGSMVCRSFKSTGRFEPLFEVSAMSLNWSTLAEV